MITSFYQYLRKEGYDIKMFPHSSGPAIQFNRSPTLSALEAEALMTKKLSLFFRGKAELVVIPSTLPLAFRFTIKEKH